MFFCFFCFFVTCFLYFHYLFIKHRIFLCQHTSFPHRIRIRYIQKLRNKLRLTRPLKDYVKYMNTPGSSMFESILDCGVGDVDGDRKNKDERSMKLLN